MSDGPVSASDTEKPRLRTSDTARDYPAPRGVPRHTEPVNEDTEVANVAVRGRSEQWRPDPTSCWTASPLREESFQEWARDVGRLDSPDNLWVGPVIHHGLAALDLHGTNCSVRFIRRHWLTPEIARVRFIVVGHQIWRFGLRSAAGDAVILQDGERPWRVLRGVFLTHRFLASPCAPAVRVKLDTRNDSSNGALCNDAPLPQRDSTASAKPRQDELRKQELYRHAYGLARTDGSAFAQVEPTVEEFPSALKRAAENAFRCGPSAATIGRRQELKISDDLSRQHSSLCG